MLVSGGIRHAFEIVMHVRPLKKLSPIDSIFHCDLWIINIFDDCNRQIRLVIDIDLFLIGGVVDAP